MGYYLYLNASKDEKTDIDFLDTIQGYTESKLKKTLKRLPKCLLNVYRKHKRIKAAKNVKQQKLIIKINRSELSLAFDRIIYIESDTETAMKLVNSIK